MFGIFKRKKKTPEKAKEPAPPVAWGHDALPPPRPLVVDFGSRKVRYAGDLDSAWFVSLRHESRLLSLDFRGQIRDTFPCPPVDRVHPVEGMLLGLDWEYAWGRRWGYSSLGEREYATGFDARTGRQLWRMDGGLAALVGLKSGLGRESPLPDAPYRLFDLRTGDRGWSVSSHEPAVASDAERVYLLERDGTIRALAIGDGDELWSAQPPDDRRVRGNLCRVLVPARDGLWYAAHPREGEALIIRLALEDGQPVEEIHFDGWVESIMPGADGILVAHEFGLSRLLEGTTTSLVDDLPEASVCTDRRGFAVMTPALGRYAWAGSFDAPPGWAKLHERWSLVRAANGTAVLTSDSCVLRWPLTYTPEKKTGALVADVVRPDLSSEDLEPATVVFAGAAMVMVEHADRGRFTVKIADTGLTKGEDVEIGGFVPGPGGKSTATVLVYPGPDGSPVRATTTLSSEPSEPEPLEVGTLARPPRGGVPKRVQQLWDVLVEHGLVEATSNDELRKTARRLFPAATVGGDAAARILQHHHGETGGLERGFLSHDWRFGQETDDVIAEFGACLRGQPIEISQVDVRPDALCVRTVIAGEATSTWVELEHTGLAAVARFLNEKLEQAGAEVRIYGLPTDGDWHAFIMRRPQDVQALIDGGAHGIHLA